MRRFGRRPVRNSGVYTRADAKAWRKLMAEARLASLRPWISSGDFAIAARGCRSRCFPWAVLRREESERPFLDLIEIAQVWPHAGQEFRDAAAPRLRPLAAECERIMGAYAAPKPAAKVVTPQDAAWRRRADIGDD